MKYIYEKLYFFKELFLAVYETLCFAARLQGDDLVPPQASFYNPVTDPRSLPHTQHTECQNIFTGEASLV